MSNDYTYVYVVWNQFFCHVFWDEESAKLYIADQPDTESFNLKRTVVSWYKNGFEL